MKPWPRDGSSERRSFVQLEGTYAGRLVGQGDPSPIYAGPTPARGAVLAFHGFAGTPQEVRLVVDTAAELGFAAHAPRLPGHGPEATGLLSVGWRDWAEAAEAELFRLGDDCRSKVVVAGLSLGSLLAAHLAATFRDRVAGLLVLANAIHLRPWPTGLPLRIFELFRPFDNRFFIRKTGADIRDPEARGAHLTYDVNPIHGAVEVLRAGRVVRAELANVTCPVLVLHGQLDRVCPPENAYELAESVGTRDVEVAILPRSGHIVSVDFDREEVARRIASFLRRIGP